MTEINTREIAETLMLDACREVHLDAIWSKLAETNADLSRSERNLLTMQIDDLVVRAEVTVTFPEASGS